MGTGNSSIDLLRRGNDTFTLERLDNILKNERYPHGPIINEAGKFLKACEIDTNHFAFEETDGELTCFGDDEAEMRAVGFCRQLYGLIIRYQLRPGIWILNSPRSSNSGLGLWRILRRS